MRKALKEWKKRRLVKKMTFEEGSLEAADRGVFYQTVGVLGLGDQPDTFQLSADLEFGSVFSMGLLLDYRISFSWIKSGNIYVMVRSMSVQEREKQRRLVCWSFATASSEMLRTSSYNCRECARPVVRHLEGSCWRRVEGRVG